MAELLAPDEAVRASQSAPLDLHEENSDSGCSRWPARLVLRSSLGEYVEGRCGASNLCAYCAKLKAVENAELLALDGLYGVPPAWWVVLTTQHTAASQARYRSWWEVAKRAAGCPTARLLEFTTGLGPRSGGERRPHWNVLLKGGQDQAEAMLDAWRAVSGSTAGYVGEVADVGGLLRYLALHFQKESQRPPAGWKGQRLTISRDYLWTETRYARELAKRSLRLKRELWRAEQQGLTGAAVLDRAELELARKESVRWRMVPAPPIAREEVRHGGHRLRAVPDLRPDATGPDRRALAVGDVGQGVPEPGGGPAEGRAAEPRTQRQKPRVHGRDRRAGPGPDRVASEVGRHGRTRPDDGAGRTEGRTRGGPAPSDRTTGRPPPPPASRAPRPASSARTPRAGPDP